VHENRVNTGRTQDEVVLCNFTIPNLLWQRIRPVINISKETFLGQLGLNLGRILFLQRSVTKLD